MRQCIVREHQLQDQRCAAKDHRITAREKSERPDSAQLHAGEHQPHDEPSGKPKECDCDREADALEQIRQREIVQEQVHQFETISLGVSRFSAPSDHFFNRSVWMPAFWIATSAAITAARNSGLSFGTPIPTEYGSVTAVAFSS